MEFNHNGNLLLTGDVCGNVAIFGKTEFSLCSILLKLSIFTNVYALFRHEQL